MPAASCVQRTQRKCYGILQILVKAAILRACHKDPAAGRRDQNLGCLTAGNRHRHVGRNLAHNAVSHQDTDGSKDNIGSGGVIYHRIFPGGTAHCTRLQHGAGCQHIRAHCQQLAIRRQLRQQQLCKLCAHAAALPINDQNSFHTLHPLSLYALPL